MNPKPLFLLSLACLPVSVLLTACSSTSDSPPPAEATSSAAYEKGTPGGVFVNTVDLTARVTAIDRTTRKVTLLAPDGKKYKVKVGPEAINFDQVKVGDLLRATVTEELVVHVGGENAAAGDGAASVVALAPKGAQPGGLVADTVRVTGTVTAIDAAKRTATIQFEDGTTQTLPVRRDIDLSQQQVGQKVVFQITEMVALSVEKP